MTTDLVGRKVTLRDARDDYGTVRAVAYGGAPGWFSLLVEASNGKLFCVDYSDVTLVKEVGL